MANLLLSALVSIAVRNLNAAALKEFGFAWGLGAELDNLKSTMSAIRTVVKYAEEKQWSNDVIKDWLGKLKDVAWDADNVLDEFATEALMRKVEREKGAASQVSRFSSLPNIINFRMKMASKFVNVYYVMGFRPFRPNYFTCTAHLYLYCTLLVPHIYASYIRH